MQRHSYAEPNNDIAAVKARTDLLSLVSERTTVRPSGANYKALCPFHQERTPSFHIYVEQQRWRCYGACAVGGDVYDFVMKAEGVNFGEALRRLAADAGYSLSARYDPNRAVEAIQSANVAAAALYQQQLAASEKVKEYLARRGITDASIDAFGLGYAPNRSNFMIQDLQRQGHALPTLAAAGLVAAYNDDGYRDFFRQRWIIPIADARGGIAGFAGRKLSERQNVKYINTPATSRFDKSRLLYGLHRAAPFHDRTAVIVEGYADVIIAHQAGFTNTVAAMGTSFTDRQAELIAQYADRVIIAPDGDAGGQQALLNRAGAIWASFAPYPEITVAIATLSHDLDPAEIIQANPDRWQRLLSQATPLFDYIIANLTKGMPADSANAKVAAAQEFVQHIAAVPDPMVRSIHASSLAHHLGISEDFILQAIAAKPTTPSRPPPPTAQPHHTDSQDQMERHVLGLAIHHTIDQPPQLQPEWFQNPEYRALYAQTLTGAADPALAASQNDIINPLPRRLTATELDAEWRQVAVRMERAYLHRELVAVCETITTDDTEPELHQAAMRDITARINEINRHR